MPDVMPINRHPLLELGSILDGRYQVIKMVANGGMGTVFLAEHVLIKRRLAIKVLHRELASDGAMVKRFMNEALAAGTLGHPHIVEATDMGFTPDHVPYIVYEYLEGSVLAEEIHRVRGFPVRRALRIACQVASALDAAHLAGIVHLDLKPENVFLTDRDGVSDHVKVLDFGISQFSEPDTEHTQRGLVIGTPEYMSPEQITDPDNVDNRADIYALGLLLYEMLTARRPFKGDDPRVLLHRICNEDPPPLAQRNVSWDLEELIMEKLLAKNRSRRFATMRQVSAHLQVFIDAMRTDDAIVPPPPRARVEPASPPPAVALERSAGVVQRPARRWSGGLFATAVFVGLAGGGMNLAATRLLGDSAVEALVLADAEELSTMLVSHARAVRQRVDGIASSPTLRASIEADAATVAYMIEAGYVFAPEIDEVFELFLRRDGKVTSILRIPATATGIYTTIDVPETTFHGTDTGITIIAGAPVLRQSSVIGGTIALARTIDLSLIKRRLADKVFEATLVGLGDPIVLAGTPAASSAGTAMAIPIPIGAELGDRAVALQATLRPDVRAWSLTVSSYAAFGFGGLLLLGSLVSRRRQA